MLHRNTNLEVQKAASAAKRIDVNGQTWRVATVPSLDVECLLLPSRHVAMVAPTGDASRDLEIARDTIQAVLP